MGRLIDADRLQKQFNEKSTNPNYRVNMHNIKSIISNASTVEAIPKDQYEARLKADMVAMLEDLDLEIDESAAYNREVAKVQRLIRDRIDELKEQTDVKV